MPGYRAMPSKRKILPSEIKAAHKDSEIIIYPEAPHGFNARAIANSTPGPTCWLGSNSTAPHSNRGAACKAAHGSAEEAERLFGIALDAGDSGGEIAHADAEPLRYGRRYLLV